MRVGALKKEALSVGLDMQEVDKAIDEADDPKAAVTELILAAVGVRNPEPEPEPDSAPETEFDAAYAARRSALVAMRIGDLKREAHLVGLSLEKVDEAIDSADDPKAAVIELILLAAAPDAETELASHKSVPLKASTQKKIVGQQRSLADRHFGALRGMGAGMLKLLGSDDSASIGKLRSLSDVVGHAGLNTPVFVAALTQNNHDDDSILKVRKRVLAAINAGESLACLSTRCQRPAACNSYGLNWFSGHRPNMSPTTNRDAVAGLWTLYHYYKNTHGTERTHDSVRAQQSEQGIATLPPAFQMKVALAAGLPRTLTALRGLFKPERVRPPKH